MRIKRILARITPSFGQHSNSKDVTEQLKNAIQIDSHDAFVKTVEDNITILIQPPELRKIILFLFNQAATQYLKLLLPIIRKHDNESVALNARDDTGTTILDVIIYETIYEHDVEFLGIILQFGASELNEFTLERKLDLDEDDGDIETTVVGIVCAIERYATCYHLKTQLLTQLLKLSQSVFLEQCLKAGYDLNGLASCLESHTSEEDKHQSISKEHILRHLPLLIKSANGNDILSLLWQIHCQATGTNTKAYHQTCAFDLSKRDSIQSEIDHQGTFELFRRAGFQTELAGTGRLIPNEHVSDKQMIHDRKTVANSEMQPPSLMQLCRNSVRIGCNRNVIFAHMRLGLPFALEEYVVLET